MHKHIIFLLYLDLTYCLSKDNVTDIKIITELKYSHHTKFNLKLVVVIFAMLNMICYVAMSRKCVFNSKI